MAMMLISALLVKLSMKIRKNKFVELSLMRHQLTRVPKNAGIFMHSMFGIYRLGRFYFSLLLIGISLLSYAQPSRSNYKAFVFNVFDAQTNKPIDDISLCMYDQTGRPLVQWVETIPGTKKNKTILDSFYCWPNHRPPLRQSPGQVNFFQRQSFAGLNKEWVCILPAFSGNIDLLSQSILMHDISEVNKSPWVPLFLQLKLHDPKGRYADALIPIPKDRCFFIEDLKQGNMIESIRLVLSKTDSPRLLDESYDSYWFPVYALLRNQSMMLHDESNTSMKLLAINAYHEETGNIVKQVLSPKPNSAYGEWGRGNLQFYNQGNTSFADYADFFVPRKDHTVGLFYTYSSETKTYVIDTAVYTKPNLRYSAHLKKLFADDTIRRGQKTCRLTYAWENHAWVLKRDSCFIVPEPNRSLPDPNAYAVLYANRPGRQYPLQVFEVNAKSLVLYDTFYVTNPGQHKVNVNTKTMEGVSIQMPKQIQSQQTVPVYLTYTLENNGNNMHTFSSGVYLSFGRNQTLSYYLTAPMLAQGTLHEIKNQQHYFYKQENATTYFQLIADSAMNIIAYGRIKASDSSRIGHWHLYEVQGQLHKDSFYSKTLRLYLADQSSQGAKAVVYASNQRNDTLLLNLPNGVEFQLREGIDSIKLFRDSQYAYYRCRYDDVVEGMSQYVYWLNYGQAYYLHQDVRVPLNFNHQQFYIQWEPGVLSREFNSEKDLSKFEYKQLAFIFPSVKIDTTDDGVYYLDARACSENERNALVQYVLETRRAKAMCKLHRPVQNKNGLLFAMPRITVNVKTPVAQAELNKILANYGYELSNRGGVSIAQYTYSAVPALVDETYYIKFNQLLMAHPELGITQDIRFMVKPVLERTQAIRE